MRIYFDIPLGREVHERHLRERPGCHRHHRLLWTSLAKVKIPIILSDIVSVLHQNEAGRYWEIHPETPETSQGSREIWRAEGMDLPIIPEYGHSIHHQSFLRECIG